MKNKEMAGIKRYREGATVNLSIGYTIHNKHC